MKKFLIIIVAFGLILLPLFYFFGNKKSQPKSEKIKVVTTLFPLYDMARSIGSNKAEVSLLLPPGVEPHAFDPKPSDIVRINEADIFIYTGKFMEPWVEDIIKSLDSKVLVVNASEGIKLMSAISSHSEPSEGSVDPHIWLDMDNAQVMAENIGRAFQDKDAQDQIYYFQNTEEYKSQLAKMDDEYRAGLKDCRTKTIVYGGHYAFGYLAKKYDLEYMSAQGFAPDAEPTAQDLIDLVTKVKDDKIKYIFYEELSSPKIAETLSEETSAQLLLLNAAHNISRDQLQNGTTFFEILLNNLVNLKKGLQCSDV